MNMTVSLELDGATCKCVSIYKSSAFGYPTVFPLHLKRTLKTEDPIVFHLLRWLEMKQSCTSSDGDGDAKDSPWERHG